MTQEWESENTKALGCIFRFILIVIVASIAVAVIYWEDQYERERIREEVKNATNPPKQ